MFLVLFLFRQSESVPLSLRICSFVALTLKLCSLCLFCLKKEYVLYVFLSKKKNMFFMSFCLKKKNMSFMSFCLKTQSLSSCYIIYNVSMALFVNLLENLCLFFKKTWEMFGGYRENLYLCTRFSELRHTPNTESNEKRVLWEDYIQQRVVQEAIPTPYYI